MSKEDITTLTDEQDPVGEEVKQEEAKKEAAGATAEPVKETSKETPKEAPAETDDDGDLEFLSEEDLKPAKPKKKFRLNIHVIMILLILIILGVAVVKLLQWNKGTQIEIDPEADTSEFDVEALDSIMPLPPSMKEGHEYDDTLEILCLGNEPFSADTGETGLAQRIAAQTGAVVYNGAFPASTLASKNLNFIEQNYPDDVFTLPYIAEAICSGDFSQMERIRNTYRPDGGTSAEAVDVLKNQVDYNSLDVICIMYDASDYTMQRSVENPLDPKERCSYAGALRYSVSLLQQAYPYVRIIVMSPYYCIGTYADGTNYDPGIVDMGNGDLTTYLLKEIEAAADVSVSILDNFYGSINQDNYKEYLDSEGYYYLNDTGKALLATRFAEAYNMYK